MAKSKHLQQKEWKERKQAQNPHGKVSSYEELVDDTKKDENR